MLVKKGLYCNSQYSRGSGIGIISYRQYLKITRRSKIFRTWPKLEQHFLILKIRAEFDKCLVSKHEFKQTFSLISPFLEIFRKFLEFFWTIYGNWWKSVEICGNRGWKFPQISVNFPKFSEAWEFPEISTDFRFRKFENVLISHHWSEV